MSMQLDRDDVIYIFTAFRGKHPELREDEASALFERAKEVFTTLRYYRPGLLGARLADDVVSMMEALYAERTATLRQVQAWAEEAPGPEHNSFYYVTEHVEAALKQRS